MSTLNRKIMELSAKYIDGACSHELDYETEATRAPKPLATDFGG